MAVNLNNTTPAAPGGFTNVLWQTDGSGNISAYYSSTGGSGGPGNGAISTKTANYTVTSSDYTILANAATASFTVTLPLSPATGEIHNIKKIDGSTHTVTVAGNGKNIDAGTSFVLTQQFQNLLIQYNGTQWYIL